MWELPGDQVDETHYEIVGEDNRRIWKEVTIAEQQFGFMPGRSTTDAIFCLRMLLEKWTEGQKAVHCAFLLTWRKHTTGYPERNCGNACGFFFFFFFIYFIFTHNQLEINHSACRNKDCE